MSIDYSASLRVGFLLSVESALKPFEKKTGEDRSHMEDRFDAKTGKKTGRVKVVDEEPRTVYVCGNIRTARTEDESDLDENTEVEGVTVCAGEHDFLEELGSVHGFEVHIFGDHMSGNNDVVFHPIAHPEEIPGTGTDCGRVDFGGHLAWADVVAMRDSLAAVRQKLSALGLECGDPQVVLAYNVS